MQVTCMHGPWQAALVRFWPDCYVGCVALFAIRQSPTARNSESPLGLPGQAVPLPLRVDWLRLRLAPQSGLVRLVGQAPGQLPLLGGSLGTVRARSSTPRPSGFYAVHQACANARASAAACALCEAA